MNVLTSHSLWFCAQGLQLAVLACMYRRRMQNHYPAFFFYIVVEVVSDPFLALAQDRWPYIYYFGYWITVCLTAALSFFRSCKRFFRMPSGLSRLSTISAPSFFAGPLWCCCWLREFRR